jgi:hypothetical protein
VYLAKKIESAKLNTLRLLSLTTINSFKIMELADELQPAGAPPAVPQFGMEEKRDSEPEISLEERTRIRIRQMHRIISRLEKLEAQYRVAKEGLGRGKARSRKAGNNLNRIKNNRESRFLSLRKRGGGFEGDGNGAGRYQGAGSSP